MLLKYLMKILKELEKYISKEEAEAMKVVLIKYGEIALKGQNRPIFEDKLTSNIRKKLKNLDGISIKKEQGRIFIESIDNNLHLVLNQLKKVFGLVAFSIAEVADKNVDSIINKSLLVAKNQIEKGFTSFKVESRRADKTFDISSMDLSRLVGAAILKVYADEYKIYVDVHNPQFVINIEVRDKVYVYSGEEKGIGGMPLGTNGKALLLLSGGIDSPVAGFTIAKRGVEIDAIHYFSFPYTSEKAKEKVIDLCKVLKEYTGKLNLYCVPFTDIQTEIYEKCNERYLTIIMRRFMMRIAEKIAYRINAQALITGESIGQVASQTMESIVCTNKVVNIPIFRPLIGMDKEEIVNISKKIGTYDISILPYEDCCTVFVPKHPKTKPDILKVEEEEKKLDIEKLIEQAISSIEKIII